MFRWIGTVVLLLAVASSATAEWFSRTFADAEVSIASKGIYGRCFIFKVTNRKMEVEIASKNGTPVEIALFEKHHALAFEVGTLDLAKATPNGDAYSPSLLRGKISAYVKAGAEWCVGVRSTGAPVQLHYIVRTYVWL